MVELSALLVGSSWPSKRLSLMAQHVSVCGEAVTIEWDLRSNWRPEGRAEV